jgi:hypothetical protein
MAYFVSKTWYRHVHCARDGPTPGGAIRPYEITATPASPDTIAPRRRRILVTAMRAHRINGRPEKFQPGGIDQREDVQDQNNQHFSGPRNVKSQQNRTLSKKRSSVKPTTIKL